MVLKFGMQEFLILEINTPFPSTIYAIIMTKKYIFLFVFLSCSIAMIAQSGNQQPVSKKERKQIERFEKNITKLENQNFSFRAKWRSYKSKRYEMIYPDYRFLKVRNGKVTSSLVYGKSFVIELRDQTIRDYDKVMVNLSSEIRNYAYVYQEANKKAMVSFDTTTDKDENFHITIEMDFDSNVIIDIISDKRSPVRYEGVIR